MVNHPNRSKRRERILFHVTAVTQQVRELDQGLAMYGLDATGKAAFHACIAAGRARSYAAEMADRAVNSEIKEYQLMARR